MKLDLAELIRRTAPGLPLAVCANLPYYITSPVIMRLLEERLPVTSITVMVQKEAAERLCAHPGERACGAVSAAAPALAFYALCAADPAAWLAADLVLGIPFVKNILRKDYRYLYGERRHRRASKV